MSKRICRRTLIGAIAGFPFLSLFGCDKGTGSKGVRVAENVAKKVVLPVLRKIALVADVVVTLKDLVVEIKALIDGKTETIQARLTEDEARILHSGGELVIKGEDGKEFPVKYEVKVAAAGTRRGDAMRSINLLLGVLLMPVSNLALGQEDPIRARLDKAKVAYDAEIERLRKVVGDSFDRREEQARKDGNKKLVDEIKAERRGFETTGNPPTSLPAKIRQEYESVTLAMTSAYERAVKDYTKAKKDEEADLVGKELAAFKKDVPTAGKSGKEKDKDTVVGRWLWGPDKHVLTFAADGSLTEYAPTGALQTTGTWKLEKDGKYSVKLKNGYSAVISVGDAGKKMRIDLADPSGRKSSLNGEREGK